VLADPIAFSTIVDLIVVHFGRGNVDKVVGIEARGFILAAPVAYHFGAGIIPVRKKGKLPSETIGQEYALEYGTASLEIHKDAVRPGERVLVVDDVLATGGTAQAAASLVEAIGGKVCGIACLIELDFLRGQAAGLRPLDVDPLLTDTDPPRMLAVHWRCPWTARKTSSSRYRRRLRRRSEADGFRSHACAAADPRRPPAFRPC